MKKWPRDDTNAKDDSYQTSSFSYKREMDQLMVANTITNEVDTKDILKLDDEEKNEVLKTTYPKYTRTNSKEEHKAIELVTPRSQMGSNDVNSKPK